jgi:cysteine-rich repeat protein
MRRRVPFARSIPLSFALLVSACAGDDGGQTATATDTASTSDSTSSTATAGETTADSTGTGTGTTGTSTDTAGTTADTTSATTSATDATSSTTDATGSTTDATGSTTDTGGTTSGTTEGTTDSTTGDDLCGNGVIDPGELCDDGNGESMDGCASSCVIECGYLCLEAGEACISGFNAVQCASAGPPFGQASPLANVCRLATLSVDGSYIALSPETSINGQPRHLDAMYTDPSNALFGFAGDTEDIKGGSQLVSVDAASGEMTPIGPSLGLWVMGAAMNDGADLWVTVFDTYESNKNTAVMIAKVDPISGEFMVGPTALTEGGKPVTVWSTHVSDVAFRFDGAMFISANEPGPPPPEPASRYLQVNPINATVLSAVEGPDDIYAAGIVFVGEEQEIVAMDIRGVDDIYILDLAAPPTLNQSLLYPDPIPTNSGTADLAGCSKLKPQ